MSEGTWYGISATTVVDRWQFGEASQGRDFWKIVVQFYYYFLYFTWVIISYIILAWIYFYAAVNVPRHTSVKHEWIVKIEKIHLRHTTLFQPWSLFSTLPRILFNIRVKGNPKHNSFPSNKYSSDILGRFSTYFAWYLPTPDHWLL